MERDYYVHPNPKKYEQYLSPFGNKVLSVLMKQWDKARMQTNNAYNQRRQFPAQNKRVLTFIDDAAVSTSYTPRPQLLLPTSCEEILHREEKSFNFDLTGKTVPEIPKCLELIHGVPPKNIDKDDFLHPTMAANKNLVHKDSYDDIDILFVKQVQSQDTNKNKCNNINWDDMLDSELLDTMSANEKENKETNVRTIFDIRLPSDNISKSESIVIATKKNMTKGIKRGIKKRAEPKTKQYRSNSGTTEENSQKIKQSVSKPKTNKKRVKKKNFRELKYAKAVKNWLNNVEPNHPIVEDVSNVVSTSNIALNIIMDTGYTCTGCTQVENIDQNAPFDEAPITHNENIVNNRTLNITKKVVQAQLANKDGVMKFSKPTKTGDEIKKFADVLEPDPKVTKEKKVKKFVAPVKSQLPVKDVTFQIRTFEENDVDTNRDNFQGIKNYEIIAVLIYSNGFCQLNSHHTDSTCAADGLIINHDDMFYFFKSTGQKLKATIKHLLENNKVVCYGARNVLIYLATHFQMEINSIDIYDAKIGASLLDPDNSPENFLQFQMLLSFTAPYTIVTECTLQKSAWYMSLLRVCWVKLCAMLVDDSLWNVFVDIEMKLLPIIVGMERRGVCIDMVKLKAMEEVLLSRMKLVEQQCFKAAGKVFQINSAAQVRAILYDELQLDTKCNVKIRETICKGAKSTSETMLRSLVSEHPLPKLILEYRHLHKAHATFLTGIAQHVKDGVVRPTWVQTAAATGRIASHNPNLQAIPKAPFSLGAFPDVGADGIDRPQLLFRAVYAARAGWRLLAADWRHVECRVFAHAARDRRLQRALAGPQDLFRVLAAQWLRKPEPDIVREERERTKRLVYASLYGAGARKLMEILDVDYQQAKMVAASFNRSFPSLKSFGRGVVSRCSAARGRLATLSGRVRRFSDIASEHFDLKSHAERQAVNFIVQGSAADLCKTAMIATERELRSSAPPVAAHLLLQLHDELLWEVAEPHVPRAAGSYAMIHNDVETIIKRVMEGCGQRCGMAGPLPVALSVGSDWGTMLPYTVPDE